MRRKKLLALIKFNHIHSSFTCCITKTMLWNCISEWIFTFKICKSLEPLKPFLFSTNEKQSRIENFQNWKYILKKKNNNKRTKIQYNERTNHIKSEPMKEKKWIEKFIIFSLNPIQMYVEIILYYSLFLSVRIQLRNQSQLCRSQRHRIDFRWKIVLHSFLYPDSIQWHAIFLFGGSKRNRVDFLDLNMVNEAKEKYVGGSLLCLLWAVCMCIRVFWMNVLYLYLCIYTIHTQYSCM